MKKKDSEFLDFLDEFVSNLHDLSIHEFKTDPQRVAVISVDVTNAFCRTGNLASERVATIIDPIVEFFNLAWDNGLRNFLLLHDCHTADAEEFDAFGEHAICGTVESEAVDEYKALAFYDKMKIIEKNSINPAQNTAFDQWLESAPGIDTFIVVGDCTDLCVYQTAMHLRTSANANGVERRVIVPENCVDTYDLPLEAAKNSPAEPHPGDLLQKLFLHHMHLNGIEICKTIV